MKRRAGYHYFSVFVITFAFLLLSHFIYPLLAIGEDQALQKKVLYSLPEEHQGIDWNWAQVDSRGVRLAYLVEKDGKHISYPKDVEGGMAYQIDDNTGSSYNQVYRLSFSPDGSRFMSAPQVEDKTMLVYGEYQGTPSTGYIQTAVFSLDSIHFAYVQGVSNKRDAKQGVYFDGKLLGEFNRVLHLSFSDDSPQLRWVAVEDDQVLHVSIAVS